MCRETIYYLSDLRLGVVEWLLNAWLHSQLSSKKSDKRSEGKNKNTSLMLRAKIVIAGTIKPHIVMLDGEAFLLSPTQIMLLRTFM